MQQVKILVLDADKEIFLEVDSALHSYQVRFQEFSDEVSFAVSLAGTLDSIREQIQKDSHAADVIILPHPPHSRATKETLLELRALSPESLVIVLATSPTLKEALSLTRAGAFEFLVRPLPGEDFRATARKAAKQILANRKAMQLEEERKRIRFQFLSVLSHELKAPIAAIEGYLELMRDRTLGTSLDAYGDVVSRSLFRVQGMRRLILDMLDLTRLESGQMKVVPETLSLEEVVNETLELLLPDAEKRKISLHAEMQPELRMVADRQHLLMVCNNLISNAIKYNREQGRVDFTARRQGEYVFLDCRDTGIGMRKEDVEKLFGEFVRIKNDDTRNIPGSGLGLSILKKIVNLYRGSVRVDSVPGEGTTFSLVLSDFKEPQ